MIFAARAQWSFTLTSGILTHIYILQTFGGYYDEDIPMDQFMANQPYAQKIQYAFAIEYNTVVCMVKLSFLWSLQKLRSSNPWIVRSLWAIQIINAVYMIVAVMMNIFPCIPYEKKWHPEIEGNCYDPYKFVIGSVSVVLITDALVLIMPTWMIYDLQMALSRRLLSIAFLSMGIIVIVIGILRLVWLSNVFKGIFHNHSVEQAYTAIECNVAIIGASGPTVKYILGFVFPCLKSAPVKSTSYNAYGYGNSSTPGGTQRMRSKHHGNPYADLDANSIEREEIEMKGDWGWNKNDGDAHSDEQRITDNNAAEGITKTVQVDWHSTPIEQGKSGAPSTSSRLNGGTAVQPTNVV
ncbi:hypothetical protein N0V90_001489 [Kalmusia sp. IMI 367209]|nr:hypothetical protein N0V90_001489 [Kalmusia sp. IMI 367209]